jgi:hypothetical protein
MKKLIVHIGYPKTATTTLQKFCFEKLHNDGVINYLGKYFDESNKYSREIIEYILYGKMTEELNKEIEYIKKLDLSKISIISNEDLSLSFLKHIDNFYIKGINPDLVIERIYKIFSKIFDEIHILVSFRAQVSMLYSFYVEIYKWKYRHIKELNSFEKFLEDGFKYKQNGNFLMFYYGEIYKKYINKFGKENVHILLFEDIKYDIDNYSQILSNLLNYDKNFFMNVFTSKQINVKKRDENGNYLVDDIDLALELNTFISKILQNKYMLKLKNRIYTSQMRFIYRNIILNVAKPFYVKKNIVIPKQTEEQFLKILNEFEKTNLKLAKLANIELDKLKKYQYIK